MQPYHLNEVRLRRLRTGIFMRSILFFCAFIVTLPHLGLTYFRPILPIVVLPASWGDWQVWNVAALFQGQQLTCHRNTMSDLLNVNPRYPIRHSFTRSLLNTFWKIKLTHKSISHLYYIFVTFNVIVRCIQVRTHMLSVRFLIMLDVYLCIALMLVIPSILPPSLM